MPRQKRVIDQAAENKDHSVHLRMDESMRLAIERCGVDLMETFPGFPVSQSDVIRLMIRGALHEIEERPQWLREQARK